jgi:hypothetical protein
MARKSNTPAPISSVVTTHLNSLRREFKTAKATKVDFVTDFGAEGIDVTYHTTIVARVRYDEGDRVMRCWLNSGGHLTSTTKTRLNDVMRVVGLPVQVYQKDFSWHLRHGAVDVDFADGVDAACVFGTLV